MRRTDDDVATEAPGDFRIASASRLGYPTAAKSVLPGGIGR